MRGLSLRQKALGACALAAAIAAMLVAALGATGESSHTSLNAASRRVTPRGLSTAADYLGVDRRVLRGELRAGRSLAQIAEAKNGKSAAGLIDALLSARSARIEAAFADGLIPVSKERERLARLRKHVTTEVYMQRGGAGRHGMAGLTVAARYLGIGEAALRGALRSGQTLAQLANASSGHSAAGLVEALEAAARQRLDAAVAAGKLTGSSEQTRLSKLHGRIERRVNHHPLLDALSSAS